MLRQLLLLLCLIPALANAAQAQDDLAYSLGTRLGERLREEMPDLPLDALLQGLRQAYRDEPLRLPQARIEALLLEHEQRLQQQREQQVDLAEARFLANEKAAYGVRELAGGVLVRELRGGHGAKPQLGSRVRVSYRGELADGSLFDQSEGPQWFRLSALIPGWQTALREMHTGARWRVVIPAAQAYGAEGAGDLIPPNAPLVFEVELLEVAN